MTIEITSFFRERRSEIQSYLTLLQNIESAARNGSPRFRSTEAPITAEQQKILNSNFYLQLYNLVESTITRCIESIAIAAVSSKTCPGDLSTKLRAEWVRSVARTHIDLGADKRLAATIDLCDKILTNAPVEPFDIDRGGGGNWDDVSIRKLCERVGCNLALSKEVERAVKQRFRDEMGALMLVKDRRNGLAHGTLSFVDCSDGVNVEELRKLSDAVCGYLEESVASFTNFINTEIVLPSQSQPTKEPTAL